MDHMAVAVPVGQVLGHLRTAATAVPELEGPAFAEEKTAHGVLDAGGNGDEPKADQQGRRKGKARDGKGGPPEGGGAVVGHGARAGWDGPDRGGAAGQFQGIWRARRPHRGNAPVSYAENLTGGHILP